MSVEYLSLDISPGGDPTDKALRMYKSLVGNPAFGPRMINFSFDPSTKKVYIEVAKPNQSNGIPYIKRNSDIGEESYLTPI